MVHNKKKKTMEIKKNPSFLNWYVSVFHFFFIVINHTLNFIIYELNVTIYGNFH